MAEQPSFHYNFRIDGYAPRVPPSAKVIKRNRVPLSCAPCRVRKLRCSRAQPCDHCAKRGDESSCLYATAFDTHAAVLQEGGSGKAHHTEERLHRLELLVAEAIELQQAESQSSTSVASTTSPPANASSDGSSTRASTAKENHFATVGPTTWTVILSNIQEVIADFGTDPNAMSISGDDDKHQRTASDGDNVSIFTVGRPPDLETVLSALPSRDEVDRRLSRYFNVPHAVLPIIHVCNFQRMYEEFWKDPHQVPIFWIAQLFAILYISVLVSEARGLEPKPPGGCLPAKHHFIKAAAQCLNLGDFTQPRNYVVESLLLYAQCKYMSTLEPPGELWLLFAVIVRQAIRMGYHRDPDHLPGISVFEGEMRRRSWAIVRQLDLLNSFQMGLPSSTQALISDTALPRNLQDSDFDETSTALPAPRPETEATHILYIIAKARLMGAFERVLKYESSLKVLSDQKIVDLDAGLRRSHEAVPVPLKVKTMAQSFADTPHVIMMRSNIEILFHKSICILHRRKLTAQLPAIRTMDICAEASTKMLEVQVGLHQEAQPGGQLHEDRWMLSSLSLTDFFLAAMVLSLVLLKERAQGLNQCADRHTEQKLDLLDKSFSIFNAQKSHSNQAGKICEALTAMSRKLKADHASVASSITPNDESNAPAFPTFMAAPQQNQGALLCGEQIVNTSNDTITVHDYFDWNAFDQYPFELDPPYVGDNLYQTTHSLDEFS